MNVVNELLGVVGNDEQDDGGGYMRVSETREGGPGGKGLVGGLKVVRY